MSFQTPPPAGQYPPFPSKPEPNGLAVASLILGILWICWIGSVLAVVFGHLALRKNTSRGVAIAGLVLGYIGIGTLVVTVALGLAAPEPTGGGTPKRTTQGTGAAPATPSNVTGVGQPITNAGMTYLVTKASTEQSLPFDTEPETGATFVVVEMTLTNKKNETKTFTDAMAKLRGGDVTFDTTSKAVFAFGDNSLLLKQVQPGLPTRGKLAFEIPTNKVKGAQLVIKDFWSNDEIVVNLGLS